MENERFEVKQANAIEMAASSSKMLQRARNMNRTGNPNKRLKTEKKRWGHSGPISTSLAEIHRFCQHH
jgi:hypothetical protein